MISSADHVTPKGKMTHCMGHLSGDADEASKEIYHIRYDEQHSLEFSKILEGFPKLVAQEKANKSGKVHFHCIVHENGESIRRKFQRTLHWREYAQVHKRDNSYSIAKVKDESKMVAYISKDGNIVENTLCYELDKYEWLDKQEFKKKEKTYNMYQKIMVWIMEQEEFRGHLICGRFFELQKVIICWYIVNAKSIPGRYQISTVAKTVYSQYLLSVAPNQTNKELWRIANKIFDLESM